MSPGEEIIQSLDSLAHRFYFKKEISATQYAMAQIVERVMIDRYVAALKAAIVVLESKGIECAVIKKALL